MGVIKGIVNAIADPRLFFLLAVISLFVMVWQRERFAANAVGYTLLGLAGAFFLACLAFSARLTARRGDFRDVRAVAPVRPVVRRVARRRLLPGFFATCRPSRFRFAMLKSSLEVLFGTLTVLR